MKTHRPPSTAASAEASSTAAQAPHTGQGNAARQADLVASAERPASIPAVGDLDYYARRNHDFTARHPTGQVQAPSYYLGYGDKYIRRFSNDVGPLLSQPGQGWLVRVRAGLQVAMESERDRDPVSFGALEEDSSAFRRFAFDTHPAAYWEAGLGDLPVADLLTIGLTPDSEDLLSFDGLVQVADIAGRLAGATACDALDLVGGDGSSTWLVEQAYAGWLALGDGIDLVLGPGSTETLGAAADAVGASATALAQGLHHGLATAVTLGARGLDALAGEGATSRATNQLRSHAQQGVEVVEDIGEWAQGLWESLRPEADTKPLLLG